jgi:hypothetical protein
MKMSEITLQRKTLTDTSTIGELDVFGLKVYTLEDTKQAHKIWGETRIPAGSYNIDLRSEGGMTQRYGARYPEIHVGMLWLRHVPLFEFIYIHVGNSAADTNGCILVGMRRGDDRIYESRDAYRMIYPKIVGAIDNGGCRILVKDE